MAVQNTVMACAQRAADFTDIEPERALSRYSDRCDTDYEEGVVGEVEVLAPDIVTRIEEPQRVAADVMCNALLLAGVAERARPREVVEVVGAATISDRHDRRAETVRDVPGPQGRRNDMIDLKLAGRLKEAILARIAGVQARDLPDEAIVGIVAVAVLDVPDQIDEARIVLHRSYRACA